jgi:microcystin-dependent protein
MSRNSSGTYTLPVASYTAGTTIKSADMNTNLSDIATALTQSVATTGVSSMTGPLKLSAGTAVAPALTLASDTTTGWYNSAAGTWVYVGSGTTVFTLAPTGGTITNLTVGNLTVTGSFSVAANRIVGEVVDYTGTSAPSLWLFPFGQAISRSTYAALFAVCGTTYGAGDGSTTFNVPDIRGRVTAGKDNMGGVAAGRMTAANVDGTILGNTGGSENVTLTTAQMPSHSHSLTDPGHTHSFTPSTPLSTNSPGAFAFAAGASGTLTSPSIASATTGITMATAGSGTAHGNLQPVIVLNKIIYAGA